MGKMVFARFLFGLFILVFFIPIVIWEAFKDGTWYE